MGQGASAIRSTEISVHRETEPHEEEVSVWVDLPDCVCDHLVHSPCIRESRLVCRKWCDKLRHCVKHLRLESFRLSRQGILGRPRTFPLRTLSKWTIAVHQAATEALFKQVHSRFPNIRSLYITPPAIHDWIHPLGASMGVHITNLSILGMFGPQEVQALQYFPNLIVLEMIWAGRVALNTPELGNLPQIRNLRELVLKGAMLSQQDFDRLGVLGRLRRLVLYSGKVTGPVRLDALNAVTELSMEKTVFSSSRAFNDMTFPVYVEKLRLSNVMRIQEIEVYTGGRVLYMPVCLGVAIGCANMCSMDNLKELRLESVLVDRNGLEELKQSLPAAEVVVDRCRH